MTVGLLYGADYMVAAWAAETFRRFPTKIERGFGLVDEEKRLIGAVLFQNFNGYNIEMSYYGPNTLRLGIVRTLARCAIEEYDVYRATVVTSKRNKRLMRSLQKIGFRLEGTQRCYFGAKDCPKNTGVRFVMFRARLEEIAGIAPKVTETQNVKHDATGL